MNKHFIGIDLGSYEGDTRSLCIMHRENEIIIIDDIFQSTDEKAFEKKVDELYEKYHFVPLPTSKAKSKSDRILNLSNLLENKKIKLIKGDLKYFQ